jgi:hypothetical protein
MAVGAATTAAVTGTWRESVKGSAAPSWVRVAHRLVDPATRLAQFTVELPAAAWNTWLLLNVGGAADWDAVKVAEPRDTHDADEAEQSAPRKKLTPTVEVLILVCPDEVSCNVGVRVSGQRHRCGLKKPPRVLASRASHELPSAALTERVKSLSVSTVACAPLGVQAVAAASARTK